MGLLDRMILAVSPRRAFERARYREAYRSFYDAADQGRGKEGWTSVNATGERSDRGARDIVRARARDLERNDDMFKAIILDLERNVVGRGIMLQVKVTDKDGEELDEINSAIEQAWRDWSRPKNCTVTGMMSFTEAQKMVVRRRGVDGGLLILKVYVDGEFRLQLLEVDDLDGAVLAYAGNRVVGGVEIDSYNRPVAYHIRQQDLNGFYTGSSQRVTADRVIYLPCLTRPSQIREFTPMASSLPRVDAVNQLTEAALTKEQVQACFGIAVTTDSGVGGLLGRGLSPRGGGDDAPYPEEYLAPGIIKHLRPGESVSAITPAGMSSTADGMIRAIQRQAGAGAGLSYEAVSRDMSQVNYSSARQGMLQDRKTYEDWQDYLVDHLLDPVYREWLAWAVLAGRLRLDDYFDNPGRYENVVWVPSGWDWIDPQKEAVANKISLETNQTTLRAICASRGQDYRDVLNQRAKEISMMRKLDLLQIYAVDSAPQDTGDGESVLTESDWETNGLTEASGLASEVAETSEVSLNGAQITGLIAIVQAYNNGVLERESALEIIMSAFPFDKDKAESILGSGALSKEEEPVEQENDEGDETEQS